MEKRKDDRRKIESVNVIKIYVENKAAVLVDISKRGLQLLIPFYPRNPILMIDFETDNQMFHLKAKVHWVSDSPFSKKQFQVGLSVIEIPPDFEDVIDHLISIK